MSYKKFVINDSLEVFVISEMNMSLKLYISCGKKRGGFNINNRLNSTVTSTNGFRKMVSILKRVDS